MKRLPRFHQTRFHQTRFQQTQTARSALSALILILFWGAVIGEYWPDLAAAGLRLANAARAGSAELVESRYFEISSTSNAGDEQITALVIELEAQVETLSGYLDAAPGAAAGIGAGDKIRVLIVNGRGLALMDGAQITIPYENGRMDSSLVPLYLVFFIERLELRPAGGLVPAGGFALHVVEAAGLGSELTRQPLDHWAVLLRQNGDYLPLELAWAMSLPDDDPGAAQLMRAALEAGSFMGWVSEQYGLETARAAARGAPAGGDLQALTGKSIAQMEAEWLRWLDAQLLDPQPCAAVIDITSELFLLCR